MPDVGRKGTNLATEYVTWLEKQESNMAQSGDTAQLGEKKARRHIHIQFVEDTSIL